MTITTMPRRAVQKATEAVAIAIKPWMTDDPAAALSALINIFAVISAGRAFLARGDFAEKVRCIDEDEVEFHALFKRLAMEHLDNLRAVARRR
jgi:hypothetical protein